MEANANKYSWVWKNSCLTNRTKLYTKINKLLTAINDDSLLFDTVRYELREEYANEYMELIIEDYKQRFNLDESSFVSGKVKRKSVEQKYYETLISYTNKLKDYAKKVEVCGDKRNSYSKTDNDATFMRIKRDYMGNDQLLPAYNVQFGVCDEYIAVADVNQYASDMDCFVPLMNKYNRIYNFYPEFPVGDGGYGSQNNYIFCKKVGMRLFMKFGSYKKETTDAKYHNDPFRPVNFKRDENNNLVCPNNKKFIFSHKLPVKGNKYGREEEIYVCED